MLHTDMWIFVREEGGKKTGTKLADHLGNTTNRAPLARTERSVI
jgi:hypothetical protein